MKNLIAVTICLVLSIAIVIVPSFFYPSYEGVVAGTVGDFNQTVEKYYDTSLVQSIIS